MTKVMLGYEMICYRRPQKMRKYAGRTGRLRTKKEDIGGTQNVHYFSIYLLILTSAQTVLPPRRDILYSSIYTEHRVERVVVLEYIVRARRNSFIIQYISCIFYIYIILLKTNSLLSVLYLHEHVAAVLGYCSSIARSG
jgi:hypothetical protein